MALRRGWEWALNKPLSNNRKLNPDSSYISFCGGNGRETDGYFFYYFFILIDFSCRSTVGACMTLSKTQASMNPFEIGHSPGANIQINNSVLKKKVNET